MQYIVLFFYTVLYESRILFDKRIDKTNEYKLNEI